MDFVNQAKQPSTYGTDLEAASYLARSLTAAEMWSNLILPVREIQNIITSFGNVLSSSDNAQAYKAIKSYVDNAGGVAASFIPGATVDNQVSFGKAYKIAGTAPIGTESGSAVTDGYQTTELTFNFNATAPLVGSKDYQITNLFGGAQLTGAGVYWDWTLDPAYRTIPLQISFPYLNTNPDDLFQYFVIAYSDAYVTPVSVIPLSDQLLKTATSAAQAFSTLFPTTYKWYRFYIHCVGSTGVIGGKLNVDNLGISKYTTPNAAAVGVWTSYTPTVSGFSSAAVSGKWRRVGNSMEVALLSTTGVTPGGTFSLSLPQGYTADFASMTFASGGSQNIVGVGSIYNGTVYPYVASAYMYDSTKIAFIKEGTLASIQGTDLTVSHEVACKVSVPIAQWTTNVNLATDFTEYAWNSTLTTVTDQSGTNNGYGVDGVLIQPFSPTGNVGVIKRVIFKRSVSITDIILFEIWDPGNKTWYTPQDSLYQQNDAGTVTYGYRMLPIPTGNGVDVYFYSAYAKTTGQTWVNISTLKWRVRKVSNGNMAEQPPVVRAHYVGRSAGAILNTPPLYTTKVVDSHSAFSLATGLFTVPISGRYRFSTLYNSASQAALNLWINGSSKMLANAINLVRVNTSVEYDCLAGDTVSFRDDTNTAVIDTSGWFQATRIGS